MSAAVAFGLIIVKGRSAAMSDGQELPWPWLITTFAPQANASARVVIPVGISEEALRMMTQALSR
jgi:hypothetical protein